MGQYDRNESFVFLFIVSEYHIECRNVTKFSAETIKEDHSNSFRYYNNFDEKFMNVKLTVLLF